MVSPKFEFLISIRRLLSVRNLCPTVCIDKLSPQYESSDVLQGVLFDALSQLQQFQGFLSNAIQVYLTHSLFFDNVFSQCLQCLLFQIINKTTFHLNHQSQSAHVNVLSHRLYFLFFTNITTILISIIVSNIALKHSHQTLAISIHQFLRLLISRTQISQMKVLTHEHVMFI